MDFYYPNFQNDMWRILGLVFFNDRNYFTTPSGNAFSREKAEKFCREKGIAIGDTAEEVVRLKDNASDKFLQVVRPSDIAGALGKVPACKAVVITGQKALETFISTIPVAGPATGSFTEFTLDGRKLRLYRMPSSSRAYPKSLESKAEEYRRMFRDLGMVYT